MDFIKTTKYVVSNMIERQIIILTDTEKFDAVFHQNILLIKNKILMLFTVGKGGGPTI